MEKAIAIMMADLSGFTAMTEIHGSAMAAKMIEKFTNLVERSLTGESYLLERTGDQVVVISPIPDDLAHTAIKLLNLTNRELHFLPVHVGLHFGEALELDGHFYGSTINLTARIAAKAPTGKILSSQDFVDALADTEAFRYAWHGQMKFKNILESKEIVELLPEIKRTNDMQTICPVCRMQLDVTSAKFSGIYERRRVFFCSAECKEIFEKHEMHLELVGGLTHVNG